MIYVFYFFAFALVLLSYKSFRGGIDYLRFFQTELAKPRSEFTPFVTVVAPCRGLDSGLKDNLRCLFEQDYPAYEIVFVVDDAADPAASVISSLLNRKTTQMPSAKLVVAAKAGVSAQKVENLREAVLHADGRSRAFVFVDSDARPSAGWLRYLVAPLADPEVGAATGYRWFISNKPTLASELRSAWNASIASALGAKTHSNFCWGGSTAIRRDVFDRVGIRDKWLGTLSDDFTVTRLLSDAELPIVFVPQALTATVEGCTFAEMLEFTTRQMKITRVYAPKLWTISLIGSGLFSAVMFAAFLLAIFDRTNVCASVAAMGTLLLVVIFSVGKSSLRLKAVRLVLTDYEKELRKQRWSQHTLWPLAQAIFFYNSVAAWASNQMTWRGIRYELKSPTETVIIAD